LHQRRTEGSDPFLWAVGWRCTRCQNAQNYVSAV
jgi:hypothetical protein